MPTLSRRELEADDIVAELRLRKMRQSRKDIGTGPAEIQCRDKRKFSNRAEAEQSIRTRKICAYRCRICRKWHVGARIS